MLWELFWTALNLGKDNQEREKGLEGLTSAEKIKELRKIEKIVMGTIGVIEAGSAILTYVGGYMGNITLTGIGFGIMVGGGVGGAAVAMNIGMLYPSNYYRE